MKYFFLTLLAIVILASCHTTPTVTPNRENILRSKKWKLSGGTLTVRKPNGRDTNLKYLDYVPDCYKDDYLTFDSMRHGTMYTGSVSCNAADPASHGFVWQLSDNENTIDLYDGFNTFFGAGDTIQYFHFDTLSHSPLILDSIVKRVDTTPGFLRVFIELDTVRELRFKGYAFPTFDIYKANITDFSSSSFTVNFSYITLYPDSTSWHAGPPYNLAPIYRPDTIHYALTYTSF